MRTLSASSDGENADTARPLIVSAADVIDAHVIPAHHHPRGQLIYATQGTLRVNVGLAVWVITPRMGVWVPSGTPHQVTASAGVSYRSVFVSPVASHSIPVLGAPLTIDPLTREIIIEAATFGEHYRPASPESRLLDVLHDRLQHVAPDPVPISLPHDSRAHRICQALLTDPADDRSLESWGRVVGASSRTLSRVFLRETGTTFSDWVRRMRLSLALDRLKSGECVTTVALDLGYASPSAFCAMFRKTLGSTPTRFTH